MKNKNVFIVMGAIFVVTIFAGCDKAQEQKDMNSNQSNDNTMNNKEIYSVDASDYVKPHNLIGDIPKADLSDEEKDGLILMREEEKLARDVYLTLYEKWGQQTFKNISDSEQTHTNTMKFLLDKYEIADPVVSDEIGVFTSVELQKLYDDLVATGEKSIVDALTVGAIVEDLDISDLQRLIAETDNEDIEIAYENLMKGSRNHLRAYVRQLEKNGATYSPKYISEEMYQQIISSEQEMGNVDNRGGSDGRNMKKGGRHQMNNVQ